MSVTPTPGRFAKPATPSDSEFWKPADHDGRLHLVRPHGAREDEAGKAFVAADIVVLDADDGPVRFDDCRVYQSYLSRQLLEGQSEAWMLARLGKGHATPGRSAAWVFFDSGNGDEDVAAAYLDAAADKAPF